MARKVLIILSNRLNPRQAARYIELDCEEDGQILAEEPLAAQPTEARYDEVWENDEGRTSFASCNRFKRRYRHALEKPGAAKQK
jgi:hypothetical protein